MTRANEKQINWTPKETEALRTMWTQGVPSTEISKYVGGRSVQSIWSKAKKLNLSRPNKRLNQISRFKDLQKGEKIKIKPYVQHEFTGGKRLIDLKSNECHFPHKGQIYCGEKSTKPYGYCEDHHAMCYKKIVVRSVKIR